MRVGRVTWWAELVEEDVEEREEDIVVLVLVGWAVWVIYSAQWLGALLDWFLDEES